MREVGFGGYDAQIYTQKLSLENEKVRDDNEAVCSGVYRFYDDRVRNSAK